MMIMQGCSRALKTLGASILLFLIISSAQANMTVYPMSAMIDETKQEATTIKILSRSQETQYIQATVKFISRPGSEFEKEQVPEGEPGIIVSPEKFILPAGVTRTVRVISSRSPQAEEAWRIYFEPVPAPNDDEDEDGDKTDKTRVKVNLIWGVLTRLMPAVPQPLLARSADGKQLQNKGNIRFGILRVAECPTRDTCSWKSVEQSVYPGETLALPAGMSSKPVRVEYRTGNKAPETMTLAPGETSTIQ